MKGMLNNFEVLKICSKLKISKNPHFYRNEIEFYL